VSDYSVGGRQTERRSAGQKNGIDPVDSAFWRQ